MTTHHLDVWKKFYRELVAGRKTFEVRIDDRDYQTGDIVVLQECDDNTYTGKSGFTGRTVRFRVGYLLRDWPGVSDGYVVLSLVDRGVRDE